MQHSKHRLSKVLNGAILLPLFCGLFAARAAIIEQTNTPASSPSALKKLSLEELMNVEITSVSKQEEKLTEVAASVQVITQEEIRRSGANSLPEVLRSAFNLQVAQVNARDWAVSARGFNGIFANKLLVLMDGRNVYSPLFSGVFWDVQEPFLQDIDRIEVVSGPGGALWGANAINGVINIISKSAKESQGLLTYGGGGTEERIFGGMRYGGKLAENVHYRVYAKYSQHDDARFATGSPANDSWDMGQAGFRMDWDVSDENLLTFQGDIYENDGESLIGGEQRGANFLSRWTHDFSETSVLQFQAYYDRATRFFPGSITSDQDTYDFDLQHRFELQDRHEIIWGLGYRLWVNETDNTPVVTLLPSDLERNLFTAFLQDKITLKEDKLFLTLGSKIEHNDYTGFEFQPSLRLSLNLTERQTLWSAVSRAVRTPSRIDRHLVTVPGPEFDSESVITGELGYRAQVHSRVALSATAYYSIYDDLRAVELGPPARFINGQEGETYGAELEATWETTDWWRLRAGYTWFQDEIKAKPGTTAINFGGIERSDPHHQFFLRSSMDLPRDVELDFSFRFIDTVENVPGNLLGTVPSYMELDVRIGWRPRENLELSLVGQNLLDNQHPEFGFPGPTRIEVERGVYGKVTWRF